MNLASIELRHLRYFLAVAEAEHFTKAAAKLHVTQPTLSHQIRQLEGQLNLELFDRVGRRVKLTAAGELLLPHARRVMRELENARIALDELHGLKRGELKVGVVQTVNACMIPEIVSRFSAAHPGIRVTCAELAVEDIEAGLESSRLDLGISFLPPTRKQLEGKQLFTEEIVAVVPANHRLAKRRKLRLRELDSQPLVLLSQKYCTRQLIDRAFAEADVQSQVQVEMNSVKSVLATVRQANLATLLPALAMCQEEKGLLSIPLVQPTPTRNIGLVCLKGANCRASAKAFAKVAAEVIAHRRAQTNS
jgi:LysR family cyn operon transcriptional activator